MGLVSGVLLAPLAPVRAVGWLAELLLEEAEREIASKNSPARRLEELHAAVAGGEIDPDEAEALEAEIIGELLAAQEP